MTTVTGVTLLVSKVLNNTTANWVCSIASGATATQLTALYGFQQPAGSGTYSVTNGQTKVTTTASTPLPVGALVWFSSQPLTFYTVASANMLQTVLTTPYTGPTNGAATAVYTMDVNVLGIYDIAVQLTVPGGIVPGYSFSINATPPQQTMLHSP